MTYQMVRFQQFVGRMRGRFQRTDDEQGATLVEYAMMLALVVIVCFVALTFFGEVTSDKLSVNAECFEGGCRDGIP
jgi:Flp pilus assembly pilin Flp